MKYTTLFLSLVLTLVSCGKTDEGIDIVSDEAIRLTGSIDQTFLTRASSPLTTLPEESITVIAPGYGAGAEDQKASYTSNAAGTLSPLNADKFIKRSAEKMAFSAWIAPEGYVNVDAGTVDFSQNLERLVGAYYREGDSRLLTIPLAFEHLVSKLSISVFDVTNGVENKQYVNNDAEIIFPAIKKIGEIKTAITGPTKVSTGKSGESLEYTLLDNSATTVYMPPLSTQDLLMYGSFTVMVGDFSYVGTLNNLTALAAISQNGICAGDHVHLDIHINDDHSAVLQAITLAPWDEYPTRIYNRPRPGIWGIEDMLILAQLINTGLSEVEGYTLSDFVMPEDNRTVNLYSDLVFDKAEELIPIGTPSHPFNLNFDGNGFNISNIDFRHSGSDHTGLFGVINGATIQNVTLKNCIFDSGDYTGALVGQSTGASLIDHCFVYGGRISGDQYVGGLIGAVGYGTIVRNCRVELELVSGSSRVGGFVGRNDGVIGNSCSLVSTGISCSLTDGGGFAGMNTYLIENAFSLAYFTMAPPTNCGAWVGNNNQAGTPGTNKGCYWNNDCIDNNSCKRVIGDNAQLDVNGLEVLPSDMGRRYDRSTGRFLNNNLELYSSLRDQMNTNLSSLNNPDYLRWAKITGKPHPVFSY